MPYSKYRPKRRREKGKLVVVTNGQTEQLYFDQFPVLGGLSKIFCHPGISNRRLLKKAQSTRDNLIHKGEYLEDIDEIWIVIDRDPDPTNPRDAQVFRDILNDAKRSSINVAYSNPAFEVWYLLHFHYEAAAIETRELERRLNRSLKKTKVLTHKYKKPAHGM